MIIIKHRNWFFALTATIIVVALGSLYMYGLKLSTDFTGGVLAQITYSGVRPTPAEVNSALNASGLKNYSVREAGTKDFVLRSAALTPEEKTTLPQVLTISSTSLASISQYSDVGPTIGVELRNKSIASISLVLLCILLFIAFAFRKVSKPVSSWMYGLMAIVALITNIIVTLGFFAALGHFVGAEVDTLFVTALLTVLGFSIHDTIVVFDRVRETLRINHDRGRKEPFEETAGRSINQTFVRSVNTSVSVILSLGALYVFGPASTHDFALTLLVGIIAGTYSSIALATPLLVALADWRGAKK